MGCAVKQIHPFSFTLQSLHSPAAAAARIPGNYSALCVSLLQTRTVLREVALAKKSIKSRKPPAQLSFFELPTINQPFPGEGATGNRGFMMCYKSRASPREKVNLPH